MKRCYRMKSSEELDELYWTHFPFFSAASQSFLIDHTGRKKLMGCSYLLMGVIMSVLTATLSLKVKVLKQEGFFNLREQILKFRHFCTAPSSLDPLSEHCPDLFCHLDVWTRTMWVINCFITSEEKRLTDTLAPLWVFLLSFSWWVHCSPCWPLPTSMATFCIRDQWNHQLAERVHFGIAVRLYCGEKPHCYLLFKAVSHWREILLILQLHSSLTPSLSVQDVLGQFCFLIFVAYTISSGLFLLWFVPETKGRAMVEIMRDFNRLNYKNTSTETPDNILSTKF